MYVYARDCLDAKHAPPQKNSNPAGSVTPPGSLVSSFAMSSGDALQVRWVFNRQFAKKITKLADKTIFKSDDHLEYAQNLKIGQEYSVTFCVRGIHFVCVITSMHVDRF